MTSFTAVSLHSIVNKRNFHFVGDSSVVCTIFICIVIRKPQNLSIQCYSPGIHYSVKQSFVQLCAIQSNEFIYLISYFSSSVNS